MDNTRKETRAALIRALHDWGYQVGRLAELVAELERLAGDGLVDVAEKQDTQVPESLVVQCQAITAQVLDIRTRLNAVEIAGRAVVAELKIAGPKPKPRKPVSRRVPSEERRKKALELLDKQRARLETKD